MKVSKEKFFSMLKDGNIKNFKIGDKKFYSRDYDDETLKALGYYTKEDLLALFKDAKIIDRVERNDYMNIFNSKSQFIEIESSSSTAQIQQVYSAEYDEEYMNLIEKLLKELYKSVDSGLTPKNNYFSLIYNLDPGSTFKQRSLDVTNNPQSKKLLKEFLGKYKSKGYRELTGLNKKGKTTEYKSKIVKLKELNPRVVLFGLRTNGKSEIINLILNIPLHPDFLLRFSYEIEGSQISGKFDKILSSQFEQIYQYQINK